ncbi:hypothetical protein Tco_0503924 [Tanacetum coccineum]
MCSRNEALEISQLPQRTHRGTSCANHTAKKTLTPVSSGPPSIKIAHEFVKNCDSLPTSRKNSQRDEILKTPYKFVKSLTCGHRHYGYPIPVFTRGTIYPSWQSTNCQKWVEAKALPTNDARVVQISEISLRQICAPRAINNDRRNHFVMTVSPKVKQK